MSNHPTLVKSVDELIKLSEGEEYKDFFISLFGIVRSSKDIKYQDEVFYIIHNIDDSLEEITLEEFNKGHIIKTAIELNNFYMY